jgi:16S rRNA (guanine527-N7)-methyltransferase
MTYEDLVAKLSESQVVITPEMVSSLKKYSALLREWNEKMNLTAITEESEVVEKHFYDCLIPAKYLKIACKTLADLGTGAGFPGLVWAICFPTAKVTLIEATGKKCTFLQAVVKELGLTNVTIINKRAEEFRAPEKFDLVVARALAPLNILMEISLPLVKVGGYFLAMKSSKGEEEFNENKYLMKKFCCELEKRQDDTLPSNGDVRINFFFLKKHSTDSRYPRPWAEILSKPL